MHNIFIAIGKLIDKKDAAYRRHLQHFVVERLVLNTEILHHYKSNAKNSLIKIEITSRTYFSDWCIGDFAV
jgi:hypothetical protein